MLTNFKNFSNNKVWTLCYSFLGFKAPILSSINLVTTSAFLLLFLPLNTVSIILLCRIIAELFDAKIGSGDFSYLASLSLFYLIWSILWIVELFFGRILYCLLIKQTHSLCSLPFLGYLLVMIFKCT